MVTTTNSFGQETSKDDTNQLNESNTDAYANKDASLVLNLLGQFWNTTRRPNTSRSIRIVDYVESTAINISNAATVWNTFHRLAIRSCKPLSVVGSSTAMNLMLHNVPGISNSTMVCGVVLVQCLVHIFSKNCIDVTAQDVSSNSTGNFADEDESQKYRKRNHHAVVLFDGTTATEKCHKENDDTDDDKEHRSREELVAQKVQIFRINALYDGCGDDEGDARNSKQQVEDEEKILDKLHTGLHFYRINKKNLKNSKRGFD